MSPLNHLTTLVRTLPKRDRRTAMAAFVLIYFAFSMLIAAVQFGKPKSAAAAIFVTILSLDTLVQTPLRPLVTIPLRRVGLGRLIDWRLTHIDDHSSAS